MFRGWLGAAFETAPARRPARLTPVFYSDLDFIGACVASQCAQSAFWPANTVTSTTGTERLSVSSIGVESQNISSSTNWSARPAAGPRRTDTGGVTHTESTRRHTQARANKHTHTLHEHNRKYEYGTRVLYSSTAFCSSPLSHALRETPTTGGTLGNVLGWEAADRRGRRRRSPGRAYPRGRHRR